MESTAIHNLTVTIESSSGVLTAGHSHVLTCIISIDEASVDEASGSGSVSYTYTYMWLKDGSVVSGQNSSTYSFSSLDKTDSGLYSCRVSVGTMNVTSEGVNITVQSELGITISNKYIIIEAYKASYLLEY